MAQNQLERLLQSVGMACFVTFFHDFIELDASNSTVAKKIQAYTEYTWKSCLSRTSHARMIVKNNQEEDALKIILESQRIPDQIKNEAEKILSKSKKYLSHIN